MRCHPSFIRSVEIFDSIIGSERAVFIVQVLGPEAAALSCKVVVNIAGIAYLVESSDDEP